MRRQSLTAVQQEQERKDQIKARMKESSVVPETYDPGRERKAKQQQKDETAKAEAEAKAKEEAAKKEEADRLQAKKKEAEDAKSKASRFLGCNPPFAKLTSRKLKI